MKHQHSGVSISQPLLSICESKATAPLQKVPRMTLAFSSCLYLTTEKWLSENTHLFQSLRRLCFHCCDVLALKQLLRVNAFYLRLDRHRVVSSPQFFFLEKSLSNVNVCVIKKVHYSYCYWLPKRLFLIEYLSVIAIYMENITTFNLQFHKTWSNGRTRNEGRARFIRCLSLEFQ